MRLNMRIYITIKPTKNKITIPFHYQHIIQSIILSWIHDEKYSDFIHNVGYLYEKRNYKLYTFSKLFRKIRLF